MKTRTAQWFECKVKYEKMDADGLKKSVTEQYVVDALSFAEAEERLFEEIQHLYNGGDLEVTDVKKAAYKDVLFDEGDNCSDRWYKAKLDFITIDERTEKEKRSRVTYLVNAESLKGAIRNVESVMSGTMIDYDAASIAETKIMEVFLHEDQSVGKENA
ncbi:MAG: DUF4494 domain-containing protein [Bacteroidales bacterium]|nr:DUF4494 domain-containing protein [Bacteroidales bacterium]